MKKTLTLKGFTLIELGVVLVILSVLSGIIVPSLQQQIKYASLATDVANGKLIYENCMLIATTSDELAADMFYYDSSMDTQYYKEKRDKDGNIIGWEKSSSKVSGKEKSVVTRMDGVPVASRQHYAQLNQYKTDYGDDTHCYAYTVFDGNSNKSTDIGCFYTWEPTTCAGGEKKHPQDYKSKPLVKFTFALSEKMGLPIYNDPKDAGNTSLKKRPSLRMRYIKHDTPIGGQVKYAYRWFIMCNHNDNTISVESSVGQAPDKGSYQIYPPTGVYQDINKDQVKDGQNSSVWK